MTAFRDRVIKMAQDMVPPRQIASIENVDPRKVHDCLGNARKAGVDVPKFRTVPEPSPVPIVPERKIVVGCRLGDLLDRKAEERGMSPNALARDLLERGLLRMVPRHG